MAVWVWPTVVGGGLLLAASLAPWIGLEGPDQGDVPAIGVAYAGHPDAPALLRWSLEGPSAIGRTAVGVLGVACMALGVLMDRHAWVLGVLWGLALLVSVVLLLGRPPIGAEVAVFVVKIRGGIILGFAGLAGMMLGTVGISLQRTGFWR